MGYMVGNAPKCHQIGPNRIYRYLYLCITAFHTVTQRKKPSHSNGFAIGICTRGQQKMKSGHQNRQKLAKTR